MARPSLLRSSVREERNTLSGSVHPLAVVALFGLFIALGVYLYALNRGAVLGYDTKHLEQEINTLKKENAKLQLSEAELRSLSRIESTAQEQSMTEAVPAATLEDHGAVALR